MPTVTSAGFRHWDQYPPYVSHIACTIDFCCFIKGIRNAFQIAIQVINIKDTRQKGNNQRTVSIQQPHLSNRVVVGKDD